MSARYTWDKFSHELRDNITKLPIQSTRGYDLKEIGARVKEVRMMRRATQAQAALRADLAMQTWSNVECGRGTGFQMRVMSRIAKAMECDLIWILHGEMPESEQLTFEAEVPKALPADILSPTVGLRIAMARKMRKMNQAQLALGIGMTQGTVSQWERGLNKIARPKLYIVADYLHVSREWLETGEGGVEATDPAGRMRKVILDNVASREAKLEPAAPSTEDGTVGAGSGSDQAGILDGGSQGEGSGLPEADGVDWTGF